MFLGLDLGTSSLKLVLLDESQNLIASHSEALTVIRPHSGWSEQNPHDWQVACDKAAQSVRRQAPKAWAAVTAIGLSGHMHGATILGTDDEVLTPCILWNDSRAHQEAKILDDNPIFRRITGNMVFPGFTAPKLVWLQRHQPKTFKATKRVLLPKDYLRLWLTGEAISDMSDASGTAWLDVAKRDWSDELLAVCELDRKIMPKLVEGSDMAGKLRPELTAAWGLSRQIIVAGGAGDNAAAAIGLGSVQHGSAFVSLGTSGVLFAAMNDFAPRPATALHCFCHALPKLWHQMGVMLTAVDALDWLAQLFNASPAELSQELTNIIRKNTESPNGESLLMPSPLLFLPYLNGERTPHNDAAIRGSFIGLDRAAGRSDLTQAVMQGVAFALADNYAIMQDSGAGIQQLMAVGGGSQSNLWLQMIANLLGCPIAIAHDASVGAALGAARLAMLAQKMGSVDDICRPPQAAKIIEPQAKTHQAWQEAWQIFRRAYPATKSLSPKLDGA